MKGLPTVLNLTLDAAPVSAVVDFKVGYTHDNDLTTIHRQRMICV
jgi:hypothetical protein